MWYQSDPPSPKFNDTRTYIHDGFTTANIAPTVPSTRTRTARQPFAIIVQFVRVQICPYGDDASALCDRSE